MPVMTGKRAMMEMLRAEGVEYIFGNPGTSESPIMDALEDFPDLKYMLTMQEGVAMGMADGYARATGKPSFVNLHIDTGLANGISLLTNAYEGGTPLVLTSGNKDVRKLTEGRTELVNMLPSRSRLARSPCSERSRPARPANRRNSSKCSRSSATSGPPIAIASACTMTRWSPPSSPATSFWSTIAPTSIPNTSRAASAPASSTGTPR